MERVSSGSPYEPLIGFSRATRVGNQIFVAGTGPIGVDGKTHGVGDPAEQARRVFTIIIKAIEDLGGSAENVVRTRTFLTRAEDWKAVGEVHGEFFREVRPASTMVVVKELLDPDWFVEIEADAVISER